MRAEKKSLQFGQPSKGQKISRLVQTALRILLGLFLVFAGISHLTVARVEFLAQVPTWLPLSGDLVVILSGIAEIALGLALILLPKQRVLVGLAVAAFFVLIFPGNISQYVNRIDAFGLNTDQARFVRGKRLQAEAASIPAQLASGLVSDDIQRDLFNVYSHRH